MSNKCILEACVDSFESACIAVSAGASRLELCTELSVGGLTPSMGLIDQVQTIPDIQIHVLIRPRSGDFCYCDSEIEVMIRDIEFAKAAGVDGVVYGALTENRNIDLMTMQHLYQAAGVLNSTFHRAFDLVVDPLKALEELIDLGINRVLTSGLAPTAWLGRELLAELNRQADGRIIILPGGGINAQNVGQIMRETGVSEIHASGRSPVIGQNQLDPALGFGGDLRYVADKKKLQAIVREMRITRDQWEMSK